MGIDNITSKVSSSFNTEQLKEKIVNPSNETAQTDNKAKEETQESKDQKINVPKEKMEEMVEGLNDFIKPFHTSLKFEFHDQLQEYYVSIVDEETKETIKEIPPKKLLDMYAAMLEKIGLFVDHKV